MAAELKIRAISPELEDIAAKELGETPERRVEAVRAFREWLRGQPHIEADPDDQMLLSFLRGCKYNMEEAQQKLDMYYTVKTLAPELRGGRDLRDETVSQALSVNMFAELPGVDYEGRKVFMVHGGKHDPYVISNNDAYKVLYMMMDYIMREDDVAMIKGMVFLLDASFLTRDIIKTMTATLGKKVSVITNEVFVLNPSSSHMVNMPSYFADMFNWMQERTKKEIRDRMVMHSSWESVYKHVPQKIMPAEYGGEAGPFDELCAKWQQKIMSYQDWYLSEEKFGVNEEKRQGPPKTSETVFGVESTFRNLEID